MRPVSRVRAVYGPRSVVAPYTARHRMACCLQMAHTETRQAALMRTVSARLPCPGSRGRVHAAGPRRLECGLSGGWGPGREETVFLVKREDRPAQTSRASGVDPDGPGRLKVPSASPSPP